MISVVNDADAVLDFVCELNAHEETMCRVFPLDRNKARQQIQKTIAYQDDFVLAVHENEKLEGVFILCHNPSKNYLELLGGFAREAKTYDEFFTYLHQHYAGYRFYAVMNPSNQVMKKALMDEHGEFYEEQVDMKLNKPCFNEANHKICMMEEKYKASYIALHTQDCWWTGKRVLAREDLFHVYVAVINEEVAGYIDVRYGDDMNHIFDFFVRKKYRRQGVGRALLQRVVKEYMPNLVLEVNVTNETAYHLYKSIGFEEGIHKTTVLVNC